MPTAQQNRDKDFDFKDQPQGGYRRQSEKELILTFIYRESIQGGTIILPFHPSSHYTDLLILG